jgi:hypothetical protein
MKETTRMPTKRKSKTAGKKRKTAGTRKPKAKRTGAMKGAMKRASRATKQVKQTAMKALAGAAAGAVRAIMPPLEKAAGNQGTQTERGR